MMLLKIKILKFMIKSKSLIIFLALFTNSYGQEIIKDRKAEIVIEKDLDSTKLIKVDGVAAVFCYSRYRCCCCRCSR